MLAARHLLAALALLLLAGTAGCGEDDIEAGVERERGPDGAAIQVVGARALEPAATTSMQAVENRFEVAGRVRAEGTAEGFDAFCTRKAPVALADRRIRPEEAAVCRRNDVGFVRLPAGYEAVAVYAPDSFRVDCLSLDQVKQVFGARGEFQRYDMLDRRLPRRQVRLVGPVTELAVTDLFVETALDDGVVSRALAMTDDPKRFVRAIEEDVALGYFGVGLHRLVDDPPKRLAIDAGDGCVPPTLANVRSGRYELAQPLYVYASERGLSRLAVRTLVVGMLGRPADSLAPALVPLDDAAAERAIAGAIGAGRGVTE